MVPTTLVALQAPRTWWGHDGWMMGAHWGWWIFWLVAAVLLVWVLVRVLQSGEGTSSGPGGASGAGTRPEPDPEQVLRNRFARGEISEEEFRRRMEVLRESR